MSDLNASREGPESTVEVGRARVMYRGDSMRSKLLRTAERLFASRGIDGVSLRQIAAAAGNANNSAVRYHFGSKERLVQAIMMDRLPSIVRRRELLAARAQPGDLRAILEAQLLPMVELAEDEDSYYLTFLEQLLRYGTNHPFRRLPEEFQSSHSTFVRAAADLLTHLEPSTARNRVEQITSIALHLAADRERVRREGGALAPYGDYIDEMLDGLVGFLLAPSTIDSRKQQRAVHDHDAVASHS